MYGRLPAVVNLGHCLAPFSLQLDVTVNNAALVLYAAVVHELLEKNLITPSGTCLSCWQANSFIVPTTNTPSTLVCVVYMNEAMSMNAYKFYGWSSFLSSGILSHSKNMWLN